jgi:hypothetical protein
MPSSFEQTPFRQVNVDDVFFDSLKADYDPVKFTEWYKKKGAEGASALVYEDADGQGAFVYLKEENEPIELADTVLPAEPRLKIGTLKIAEHIQGERLGEGALGLASALAGDGPSAGLRDGLRQAQVADRHVQEVRF